MKIKWRGRLSLALRTDFWRNWEKTFNLRHSISKWYRYLSQILLIPITNTYQNPNFNLFVFSILAEADNVLISEVSFSGMIHYVMLGLRWMSYHLNFGFSGSRVHFPSMSCRCWVTTYSHCHWWFSMPGLLMIPVPPRMRGCRIPVGCWAWVGHFSQILCRDLCVISVF